MTEPTYTAAQEKALEMGKSLCVTAGAGTGKTFLLTQRYLRLLESGALPRDIVALTYTEKAAAEMQTKISRELKKQAEVNPAFIESRDTFPQGIISTFHGFCLSILKEFAYEADLDPGFSVMDELDKTELVEKTIADVLEKPPEELFEDVVTLFAYGNAGKIKSIIRAAVSVPKDWFAALETDPETIRYVWLAAYKESLRRAGVDTDAAFFSLLDYASEEEYLKYLKDWFLEASCSVTERVDRTKEWSRKPWQVKYAELAERVKAAETGKEIRRACIPEGKITVKGTKTFPVNPSEAETASEFLKIFETLSYLPGKDSRVFTLTRRLLLAAGRTAAYCAEKIAAEKRRAGVLDFDDLLEKTDELLSEKHPEILQTIASRCRYLLVDEVQDNDPKLISLVRKLCGDPKENDRLFVVGDAKQSIYLFRGADVAGFIGMQKDFGEESVALDTSFRSAPAIIELVNAVFTELFKSRTNPWDPEYDAITPHRSAADGSVTQILIPYSTDKASLKQTEAEALAAWIYDAVENRTITVADADENPRAARYSDVAILIERRSVMPHIRAALDTYHIPYEEGAGKDFYTKQETADLRNVLSAVLYPEEDIPLYGALRSPYFAVSDAELETAAHGKRGILLSRLQRYAKENPDCRTAAALSSIKRWQEYASHLHPAETVRRILAESEIFSIYAGISGGAQMEGNLLKLLDILRSRADARPFSLYEFVELLETSMDAELQEGDGEPADDAGNRVRIMTVHASKGLEFPIVCVAYAGSGKRSRSEAAVSHETLGFGVSVYPSGTDPVNIVATLSKDEMREKEDAEHKRLFYVALTRARDHLVLSGAVETKDGPASRSFLALYDSAKEAVENPPALCTGAVCEPSVQEADIPCSAFGAISVPLPECREETVCSSQDTAYAMQRGSRLHAVFAGESDDAEFADQYAEFLSCPLMENVVFERCEMSILCGSERRVIDRFVQYADGTYAVIDYKTGSLAAAKERGLFAQYAEQVGEYVQLMQEMTGGTVSGWLYFADEEEDKRIVKL